MSRRHAGRQRWQMLRYIIAMSRERSVGTRRRVPCRSPPARDVTTPRVLIGARERGDGRTAVAAREARRSWRAAIITITICALQLLRASEICADVYEDKALFSARSDAHVMMSVAISARCVGWHALLRASASARCRVERYALTLLPPCCREARVDMLLTLPPPPPHCCFSRVALICL